MIEANDLILKELDIVQSEIARFDNNGLAVKQWCLAVWASTIAYGVEHDNALIVFTSEVTTLAFSLVELAYRRFQWRFISRSKRIEDLLASNDLSGYRYDVHYSAVGQRGDCRFRTELRAVLRQPHFTLFYLTLAVFGLACAIYVYS